MTAIHVEVTADDIAAAMSPGVTHRWCHPLEAAIARLTGQDVDIDGDGYGPEPASDYRYVATIGAGEWTLVVNLPAEANAWLEQRWRASAAAIDAIGPKSEPATFRIPVPTWIEDLVAEQAVDA